MRSKTVSGLHSARHLGPAQWIADSAMPQAVGAPTSHNTLADTGVLTGLERTHPTYARTLSKGTLTIECLNWDQAGDRFDAWRALAAKSIETNVFNEPEFALSAAQHFAPANKPVFLFISEKRGGNQTGPLAAGFAIQQPRRVANVTGRLWCPPEMAVGTPLINPEFGIASLDLLEDWLASEFPAMGAFMLPMIPATGSFSALVQAYTGVRMLQSCQFDLRSRAVLRNAPDTADRVVRWMGRKRHKEMRRLWRRLAECGSLEFMTAKAAVELKSATEYFLALEAMGWKGKRGTALICDPSLATFTRTMSRRLASQFNIEIDALTIDRFPVAMAIVLRSGTDAYFWKTTYKEEYAQYSPGVLLALGMTSRLLNNPDTRFINSCAVPNHPMIDHLWPDRIEMTDLLIGIKGRSDARFTAVAAVEGGRRKMRAAAKSFYHKMRASVPG